jgi:hypothetical protein
VPAVSEAPSPAPSDPSLYCDDRELHRRIASHLGWDRFKAALRACESKDAAFPRVNPLWRGRYFPAVKRWLDADEGLDEHGLAASTEDGPEDFDAASRKNPKAQARPASPAVLDHSPGRARPEGLPGNVRSITARRR